jgi:hypothetical protein
MGSTAETGSRAAGPGRAGATAFEEFVERYVLKLRRTERAPALAALKAVALEAQAVERRRLCTDARYHAAAVAQTLDEIARHAPRPRTARIASHLASRVRSRRANRSGHPTV